VIGGMAVVGDNRELLDRLKFLQNAVGGIAGPFDSSWCCAESRHWRCAWNGTARARLRSPNGRPAIPLSLVWSIPD
jgi:hypothetical protein